MNMTDIYASRHTTEPKTIKREDPVVYCDPDYSSGPLTKDQLLKYERDGWLLLDEFKFTPKAVKELRRNCNLLRQEEDLSDSKEVIREPQNNEVRSIFRIHEKNSVLEQLVSNENLLNIAEQILDSQVYIHQSRVNFKPAFEGKEFYWHSDFETWHMEDGMPRMRSVSCVVLLTDNHENNGSLMVIPRSHEYYISCIGRTPINHYKQSLKKQQYGVPDHDSLRNLADAYGIQTIKANAGSVFFFDCNLIHGSNSNISPWPRSNIFFVYNSIENKLEKPFCGLNPRPPYIANRKFSVLNPAQ